MKQNIDFNRMYNIQHGKNRKSVNKNSANSKLPIILLALIFTITFTIGAFLKIQTMRYSIKYEQLAQTMQKSNQKEILQEKMNLQAQYNLLAEENKKIQTQKEIISKRPLFLSNTYRALINNMNKDMILQGIVYGEDGVLSATFIAPAAKEVPSYINKIRTTKIFGNISYQGWYINEGYLFQVNCLVREVN